jgi:cytoskeletal protein RodZ
MFHRVGDLFELNVKLRCQKVKLVSKILYYVFIVMLQLHVFVFHVIFL